MSEEPLPKSLTEDQRTQLEYSGEWNTKFWEVQAKGLCGETKNSGGRCTNKITEWFNLDPDRPGAIPVGACGVHVKDVGPRAVRFAQERGENSLRRWEEAELYRIARAFRVMGFEMNFDPGYRGQGAKFIIKNPGQFIATLDKLGVAEQLGLDLNTEECGAEMPNRTYITCHEPKGHQETLHSDWRHNYWKDPEPVVPEPEVVSEEVKTVSSDGGSFS